MKKLFVKELFLTSPGKDIMGRDLFFNLLLIPFVLCCINRVMHPASVSQRHAGYPGCLFCGERT